MKSEGKSLPELLIPSARLNGKDGQSKNQSLNITAEVVFPVEADHKSAVVSVFVQPDSEQTCLLRMNAIPELGIKFLHSNGVPSLPCPLVQKFVSFNPKPFLEERKIPVSRWREFNVPAQFKSITCPWFE